MGEPGIHFSEELRQLAAKFESRPAKFAEILEATRGRGFNLMLMVVSLPFLTPIPLPGFSIPFGVAVAVVGGRMALGQQPWLPQRLLQRELPPRFLSGVLSAGSRVVGFLERFLRPRLSFVVNAPASRRVAGVLLAISGIYLLLPLPIPFSNGLPAWSVLLLSAAALAGDGLCYLAGCLMFLVATAFFVAVAAGGAGAVNYFHQAVLTGHW